MIIFLICLFFCCLVSSTKTNLPRSVIQLYGTIILVQTSFLSCQLAHSDEARSRKAILSDRGLKFDTRCAVQGLLFSNLFNNLYGYIYFSS